MKSYLFLLFPLLLTSTTAFSGSVGLMRSITSIVNNTHQYEFTIAGWQNPDPSRNPCLGQSYCQLKMNHRHTNAGPNAPGGPEQPPTNLCSLTSTTET